MELKRLGPQFRTLLTADFLTGRAPLGLALTPHVKDFLRPPGSARPDLEPLVNIVGKGHGEVQ